MKNQLPTFLISFALASAVNGAIYSVNESLLPSNTNPDTSATAGAGAMGTFTGSYDTATGVLGYTMTWSGLSSLITGSAGAHIHGPTPLGSNAGVLHTILSGSTSNGGTSGT